MEVPNAIPVERHSYLIVKNWGIVMGTEDKSRGFWSSFAGILTALAGLITAIAGLVIALRPSETPTANLSPAGTTITAPPNSASTTANTSPAGPPSETTPDYSQVLQAKQLNGDWVRVLSISPPPTTPLAAGTNVPFTFRVEYMLKSADSARLATSINGHSSHIAK